jgi:hypothetical protein
MAKNFRMLITMHPDLQHALRARGLQVGQTPSLIITLLVLDFLKADLPQPVATRIRRWAELTRPGRPTAPYNLPQPLNTEIDMSDIAWDMARDQTGQLQPAEATVIRAADEVNIDDLKLED